MRSQHKHKLLSAALALICGIGLSGCQRALFPSNPFAGKLPSLPIPRLNAGKFQAPKLPGLSSLPRPNFGNLVRSATTAATPAAQAIAAKSEQPPSAPAFNFNTQKADKQLAASSLPADVKAKLNQARKAAEASRAKITTAQDDFNSAIASTTSPDSSSPNTDNLFERVKPDQSDDNSFDPSPSQSTARSSSAGSNTKSGGLWGDYKPDTRPGSSNRPSGGIEALAKVNPQLYDRYGKLTTPSGASTGQFVPTNSKKSFDFQPQIAQSKTTDTVTSDDPEAAIASLRNQLLELRTRGSGTSDQFKLPLRSAIEIAGNAPVAPKIEKPLQPLHRGFGDAANLSKSQLPVSIPDPTAPTNFLRAPVASPPGLVATQEINTGPTTRYQASEPLAIGSPLSNQLKSSTAIENMVNNEFAEKPSSDTNAEAPVLRASAVPRVANLELPRQLSQQAIDAIQAARVAKLDRPLPQVNQTTGPIPGGTENPTITAQTMTQPTTTVAARASAFPRHIAAQTPTTQQRVTTNQFFDRAAISAPAQINEPQQSLAQPSRIADLQRPVGSVTTDGVDNIALPTQITDGDGSYAPGSVRGLEKKLW